MQPHDLDPYIAAALDEFVTDTQNLLDAAQQQKPLDKDEIGYWKRQRNAFAKAQHYFLNGVRLTETPSGYTVASASRPGSLIHRCYKVGEIWTCSCEAGEKGIFHWHTALVAAYERGAELATLEATIPDVPAMPAWIAEEDAVLNRLALAA
jgi:hypothetical protein